MRRNAADPALDTFEPVSSYEWIAARYRAEATANRLADGDILTFIRERLGFAVEPSQLEFLTSNAKRGIVNCSRQWGKSTLGAIKAIYRMWTRPGSQVLVVSPTLRQSGLFLRKVRTLSAGLKVNLKKDPYLN